MLHVQRGRAATQSFAQRHLRIGATSFFFSATLLAVYIFWNLDILHKDWRAEDFDDAALICLAFLCTFTAFSLRRAAYVVTIADAERLDAERLAENHRLWLEAVVRQMPVGVGVLSSPSGDLLLANDQYYRLLGMNSDEAGVTTMRSRVQAFDGSGQPYDPLRRPGRGAIEAGQITHDEEVEVRRADGEKVWMSVSAAPVRDAAGSISAVVVTFIDITERRAAAAERAAMMRSIINAQETERLRIARELHDELGQDITGLSVSLKVLELSVAEEKHRIEIRKLRDTVGSMNTHVHGLLSRLRPLMLKEFGLRHALEELALGWGDRLGIRVDMHLDGLAEHLSDTMSIAVYRVVQEALTNIAKHSDATSISVTAQLSESTLRIVIEDDGRGFEIEDVPGTTDGHFGMAGMVERLSMVGGNLHVESSPGAGTTLYATLPLLQAAP